MVRIEFITSLISVLWSHDPSGDLSGDPFCTPLLAQEGSVPATSHGGNRCSREHYVLVQTLFFYFSLGIFVLDVHALSTSCIRLIPLSHLSIKYEATARSWLS